MSQLDCGTQATKYLKQAVKGKPSAYLFASYYYFAAERFHAAAEAIEMYSRKEETLGRNDQKELGNLMKVLKDYATAKKLHELIFSPELSPFPDEFFEGWIKAAKMSLIPNTDNKRGNVEDEWKLNNIREGAVLEYSIEVELKIREFIKEKENNTAIMNYLSHTTFVLDARKLLRK